jgi:hypothetical protein
MGYDAACTLKFEGREDRGTAWLEHQGLIFRGPNRLAIPLKEITEACADGGTLHVRFAGKRAAFEIGAAAAKWADRITNPPSRLHKLGIKPGMQVALVGGVEADFEREVAARGASVSRLVPAGSQRADAVFYLATAPADLARVPSLSRALAPGGALWILRPKGRPEISEADTMAAGKKAGLVDVKVVSFSETHSAEKYMVRRSAPLSRASAIKPAAKRARSRRSSSPSPRKS